MFNYKTLEDTNIEIIHKTFVKAFSDYQVKMDLPFWKFKQMLVRRGYASDISIGAFKDGELVGFVLNGFREWNGKPTVYDTGTGVIDEFRKQGITSNMLLNTKRLLKEKGVGQYLLEAIKSNTAAVELYKKQGFEVTRELSCYQLDKNNYNSMTTCKIEQVDRISSIDWRKLKEFWDFTPSWQNSIDSINAIHDAFIYSVAHFDDAIVGYGIIDKKTGDIPQIAVHKDYRHKGIGRSLVTDLIKSTESYKISVINVDSQSKAMGNFLLELGFIHTVEQYEMVLEMVL